MQFAEHDPRMYGAAHVCMTHTIRSQIRWALQAMAELGRLLVYELSKDWLPTMDVELQTPMGPAEGTIIDVSKPVKV